MAVEASDTLKQNTFSSILRAGWRRFLQELASFTMTYDGMTMSFTLWRDPERGAKVTDLRSFAQSLRSTRPYFDPETLSLSFRTVYDDEPSPIITPVGKNPLVVEEHNEAAPSIHYHYHFHFHLPNADMEKFDPLEMIKDKLNIDIKLEGKRPNDYRELPPIHKEILSYVSCLSGRVADKWKDSYMKLWIGILDLEVVKSRIYDPGKQKGSNFNRNLVANIIYYLGHSGKQEDRVFPNYNATYFTNDLGHKKGASVRAALGKNPPEPIVRRLDSFMETFQLT